MVILAALLFLEIAAKFRGSFIGISDCTVHFPVCCFVPHYDRSFMIFRAPATISEAEALYLETKIIKGPSQASLGLKSNFLRILPSVT